MNNVPCSHALVLAGGKSRRMGRDKAAIEVSGANQLDRSVKLLQRHLADVRVSVRADQVNDPLRSCYRLLCDTVPDIGPLAGIVAALEECAEPWLVLACDLPRVDDETIATLLAAVSPESIATAYASTHDGLPEPLCAVWMPSALPVLREAIAAGLHCPRRILIRNEAHLIQQPHDGALDNMNTPQDLQRLAGVS